jgi:hypothetical protein
MSQPGRIMSANKTSWTEDAFIERAGPLLIPTVTHPSAR